MSGAQSGRTIVPCIHCGTRMNLPVERKGIVKCPVCGGERWASTVDDGRQTAQSPAQNSGSLSPAVATILSVPAFIVGAGLGAVLGWLMATLYLFSIGLVIGPAQSYTNPSHFDRAFYVLSLGLREFFPFLIVGTATVMIGYSIASRLLPNAKLKAVSITITVVVAAGLLMPFLAWMIDPMFRSMANPVTHAGFIVGLVAGIILAFENE